MRYWLLAMLGLGLMSAANAADNKPADDGKTPVPAIAPEDEKFELPKAGRDGYTRIFNGKDLTGWYGSPEIWSVDNGEIVGKSAKGIKQNNFLRSKFEVGDFRLVVQMKLVPAGANSGIQFRSITWKGYEMKGYQADAGVGYWGKIYEESGRGVLTKEGGEKFVKSEEWNTYEIVAVGHTLLMAINGQQCAELEDGQGALTGLLALQVHSGGPTEVRFKDFKFELKPKLELVTVKKDAK